MDKNKIKTVRINKMGKRVPMAEPIRKIVLNILIEKFGCVCWYCGIKLEIYGIHVDHIVPLSKGGQDNIYNLALACVSCNRAKWNMTLRQFFSWIKRIRWMEDYPAHPAFGHLERYWDKGDEVDKTTEVV